MLETFSGPVANTNPVPTFHSMKVANSRILSGSHVMLAFSTAAGSSPVAVLGGAPR